jgi:hypothetical protein
MMCMTNLVRRLDKDTTPVTSAQPSTTCSTEYNPVPNIILCMLVKLFSIKTCRESMTRSCGKASDAAASNCSLGGCVLGLDGLGDGVV